MKRRYLAAAITLGLAAIHSESVVAQSEEVLGIEEVIVTARKIEESLQETPVSVAVVNSSLIDNLQLENLADIAKVTPGLTFDNEFSRGADRPVIRGQANILGASGVSYFIDGVYIEGSIADYDVEDIEQLEVVKGPQSALYGRNTYSGAINIKTKNPGDSLDMLFKGTVGEHGQREGNATIRGPLSETLSGGVTARYYSYDGEHENLFDGQELGEEESKSLSALLVWQPSDRLEVRGRVYHNERDDGQSALFHQSANDNNCFFDNGSLYGGAGRYFCGTLQPGVLDVDLASQIVDGDARQDDRITQSSINISYDINDTWSLQSISGYNESVSNTTTDGDYQRSAFQTANFTPGGFPFSGFEDGPPFNYGYVGSIVDFTFSSRGDSEDFSQEIRFNYDGDRVRGLIGGYYFTQNDDSRDIRELPVSAAGTALGNYLAELAAQQTICGFNPVCESIVPFFGPGIAVPRDRNNLERKNTALFGLLSYDFTDRVTGSIEARYADEEIERTAIIQDLGGPAGAPAFAKASFDSFNPRATLDWQVNDNSLLYAVYAEGNKPGGFNSTVAVEAGLPTFDEEEVTSFELGSKNIFAGGQLTLNGSIFFNDIEGYQLTQNARSGANTTSATVNAGDADVFGIELEASYRPETIEGLTLTANYAYLDPEFTDGFDQNEGVLLDAADDGLVNCSTGDQFPNVDGCTSLFGSIDGKQIPRTSENQAYFDIDFRRPWRGDWQWYAGANVAYESSKYAQVHNFAESGDSTLLNARLGVQNDVFGFQLWGKNLTDEDATPVVLRYADGAGSFRRSFVGSLRRGTQLGLTFTANFKNL